jgi:hypothetical protein
METSYVSDLQRRTDMSENERHHHKNQIERQVIEREKEQRDFELKYGDIKEKFESEKQRIGMKKEIQKKNFLFFIFQRTKIKIVRIVNYIKKKN